MLARALWVLDRRTRDKAKVEGGVLIAPRWILARLRNITCFSLDEINERIARLVADLNSRVMKRYGKSRRQLFEDLDLPELDIRTSTSTPTSSGIRTTDSDKKDHDVLREPSLEKLNAMRLDAIAATWSEQAGEPDVHKLAFDERFGMLVDAEWLHRENKGIATALRDAKLRLSSACVEDIDYPAHRELDRAQVRQLASCRWVVEHQNVLITGATGTGKTTSPARSPNRRAAKATARSTAAPRACSRSSCSRGPREDTRASSPRSPAPTCS